MFKTAAMLAGSCFLFVSGAVAADYYMVSILDRQGQGYSTRAANADNLHAGAPVFGGWDLAFGRWLKSELLAQGGLNAFPVENLPLDCGGLEGFFAVELNLKMVLFFFREVFEYAPKLPVATKQLLLA